MTRGAGRSAGPAGSWEPDFPCSGGREAAMVWGLHTGQLRSAGSREPALDWGGKTFWGWIISTHRMARRPGPQEEQS
ncbi:hypothetical protein GCM10010284_18100 [Streptomyces rubiginosohelvolus]|nr:hypothetical protein GCM10010284_18100 [Streptomyces rubiginosohelvolus]